MNTDVNSPLNKILRKSTSLNRGQDLKKSSSKSTELKEFQDLLKNKLEEKKINDDEIKISKHAQKRLDQREIRMDSAEYLSIKEGLERARHKGGRDALILTDKGAYIVDVKTNTLVTAMDKNQLKENVVTKIDTTVFM